jgi:hypothetical protein
MIRRTEESLIDALSYFSLRDLPEPWDKENIWIKAIAKVVLADGCECYVYVERTPQNEPRIKRVFGGTSSIVKILEYYPFSYLKAEYMPIFEDKKDKASRIAYLQKGNMDVDYSQYSLKRLNAEILAGAIARQLYSEKIEKNKNF